MIWLLNAAFAVQHLTCPPTKTNIMDFTPAERRLMQEKSDTCMGTKSFICLYEFVKRGKDYYTFACGPMIKDRK